jgi:Domain of unknown function (DUF1707)/Cell wall-active antibiotics response 4TMS YvqF
MAQSGPDKTPLLVPIERERERTIELLSQHFAHDNITLDELEQRLERVYRASSVPALRELTRDLPAETTETEQRRAAEVPDAFAPESDRIISIMAETKRRGIWRVPRRLTLWSVMSDTRIDLTEAQLASGVTEIKVRAIMASTRVIVPPGVRVVVQPSALMSAVVDDVEDQPAVGSGAPVVRITGPVIMSELKVKVRRREELSE